MAKNETKVMRFVEKELGSNPQIETSALYDKAKNVDPSVADLSLRQFNARFPLQVKRKKSLARARPKRTRPARRKSATANHRDAVREAFLRFAEDLTSAEEKKDLVRVLAGVDKYVDQVLQQASASRGS